MGDHSDDENPTYSWFFIYIIQKEFKNFNNLTVN